MPFLRVEDCDLFSRSIIRYKMSFCKVEEGSVMIWTVMAISGHIYGCDLVSRPESSYDD